MRHRLRSTVTRMTALLAVASLPLFAAAQEVAPVDAGAATAMMRVAEPGWLAHAAPLDEDTLGRQHGRAPGFEMVAATPQMTGGGSVTLWDEIAPPAPMPIPVDVQRSMQGNSASYTRK